MGADILRSARPLFVALAVVFLFAGCVALYQDRLIYFPENQPLAAMIADARASRLSPWPDEGDYRGFLREPVGPARGTVVLFHGNAGHAGHRAWYADELGRLGLRVILAEYPAYGARAGRLGEAALVADTVETLALARRQFPGPLLLAGESLGAGVAAAAISADVAADIAAVLLITPWDSIENVARHHYPWLPVGWLLRDRYDSVANLSTYNGRVAVVVAERDSIVPAALGRRLFESVPQPKRLWIVPAADHNDWMGRVDSAWWPSVVGFLVEGQ
jgi:hypothetical protein